MSARPSRSRLLFGTDEPAPEAVAVHAGPLELVLRGGKLWHLRVHDAEVWHGIAFPYRDVHWRTPEPMLQVTASNIGADSFCIRWAGAFLLIPIST